jgi:hypothetical protein
MARRNGRHGFVISVALMMQLSFSKSSERGLEAIVARAKLPTALYSHAAVYDGNDSVYIFGG